MPAPIRGAEPVKLQDLPWGGGRNVENLSKEPPLAARSEMPRQLVRTIPFAARRHLRKSVAGLKAESRSMMSAENIGVREDTIHEELELLSQGRNLCRV